MLYYQPAVPNAYENMKDLDYAVSYGMFLRNMHRWAAHLMVISVFLHMLRVFFHGAYKPPREFNWVIGVALFILTLLLSYTGYLLPYDQLAYWAVTVGASLVEYVPLLGDKLKFLLLGGNEIGDNTLIRFYVLHCIILPGLSVALIGFHFWRIRKDGGLHFHGKPDEPERNEDAEVETDEMNTGQNPIQIKKRIVLFPRKVPQRFQQTVPKEKLVPTFPNLIIREAICFQVVTAVVALISLFFNAPLEMLANPVNTPNPAKAPWYFLGIQELLHYFPPVVAGVLIPVAVIVALTAIPYLVINVKGQGLWTDSKNRNRTLLNILLWIVVVTGISLVYHAYAIAAPTFVLGMMVLLPYIIKRESGWIYWLARRPVSHWIMTWFVIVVTILTIIGTHFRGAEWKWVWP